jgi:zinc and cadmium transporter
LARPGAALARGRIAGDTGLFWERYGMHTVVLLVVYCAVSVVFSLAGGWIPLLVRLTHRRMQIAISFVSGIMLGIGLLHLLPHSYLALGSIDSATIWTLLGFLFMFFLERFFHFHHHDVAEVDDHARAHHEHEQSIPWGGAAIGLTLHALVDGVAMAAAVAADEEHAAAWAGLGAVLAVVLHKPFDSLTIGTLMAAAGRSAASRHMLNFMYSLVTPLGVLLFYASYGPFAEPQYGLGQALGFAAGAFICIASSDLLPELQFHRHDRTALSLALVAGIAVAWSTIFLEEGAHGHQHDELPPAEQRGESHLG